MTEFLFREAPYLQIADASIVAISEEGGIVLDRTIFYASSGGQPGDTGTLTLEDGTEVAITGTVHPSGDKSRIIHLLAEDGSQLIPGMRARLSLNWERRHKLMRMHTALHLLSVAFPFAVTGGSVGEDKGRLDFDMPDVPDNLPEIETLINDWIKQDHPVTAHWISDDELEAQPNLVKTMTVKPPVGQGRVRLIRIGTEGQTVDLQPCGGTHVASTTEIGALRLGKIEKKGRQNRRVSLHFV